MVSSGEANILETKNRSQGVYKFDVVHFWSIPNALIESLADMKHKKILCDSFIYLLTYLLAASSALRIR
jgi:TRAP-type uncharacterized transport system substrate-binding protein